MHCPNCGKEIADSVKFCKFCGSQVPAAGAQQATPEVPKTEVVSVKSSVIETQPQSAQTQGASGQVAGREQQVNVTIGNLQPMIQKNGVGTAGFVLALIGLFLSWVPLLGWIDWFLGAVLSVIGIFRKPRGLAIAGTVISFIDLILLITIFGGLAAIGAASI